MPEFQRSPHAHLPEPLWRQVVDSPAALGRWVIGIIQDIGRMTLFFLAGLLKILFPPYGLSRILFQIHFIGAKSLLVVGLTGLFTGMVLGIQGYYTLVQVGTESLLGLLVALSLVRELGPVLTALMVTGRAGSSMAAEIGIMRISEQIDALDTMDVDPIKYLVTPRLYASIIAFPLLTAFCNVVGIVGGYITGVLLLGINAGTFLGRMESGVALVDVRDGFIKSLVFAVIVSVVCCYQGYMTHTRQEGFGARGVSFSTTKAVVMSSAMILVADYVLTSLML